MGAAGAAVAERCRQPCGAISPGACADVFHCIARLPSQVSKLLPSERSPTISQLVDSGFVAVEVIVDKSQARDLIPTCKRLGATGIVVCACPPASLRCPSTPLLAAVALWLVLDRAVLVARADVARALLWLLLMSQPLCAGLQTMLT